MSNFHPVEVVGRGSETQIQMGENLIFKCSALIDLSLPLEDFFFVLM